MLYLTRLGFILASLALVGEYVWSVLADGNQYHFGAAPSDLSQIEGPQSYRH